MLASHFVSVIELITIRKFPGCTVWLGPCAFTAQGLGSTLFRELRSQKPHGMDKNNDDKIKEFVIEEADLKN